MHDSDLCTSPQSFERREALNKNTRRIKSLAMVFMTGAVPKLDLVGPSRYAPLFEPFPVIPIALFP